MKSGATKIMVTAILLGIVGRWANNKKALPSPTGILEVLGALVLVSLMDRGRSAEAARGFAWLFFAAVLLSDSSPLTGLARAENFPAPSGEGAGIVPLPTAQQGPEGASGAPANPFFSRLYGTTPRASNTPVRKGNYQ